MGDQMDQAKGRMKEKVGEMTDDEQLEREGKIERKAGEAKERAGDAVDAAKDKAKDLTHRDR
jgi:uncharacterized protein YjbJ (UPF0337 family)